MRALLKNLWHVGFRLAVWAGIVLTFVLVLVTQTPFGREKVLREVVARVGGGIHGTLAVGGVSSPGLLRGFTFREVSITGEDGRAFLLADSVRGGISVPALLRGDLVFTGVRVWRPRITLEQLPGQKEINAAAIFGGEPPPESSLQGPESLGDPGDSAATAESSVPDADSVPAVAGGHRTVVIRGAQLVDGSLDILLPLEENQGEGDGILVEAAPGGGGSMRRMSFWDLDLRLDQAMLAAPEQRGERFEVGELSFTGRVWPEEFRITGAEGEVRREGGRLAAVFERLEMPGSLASGRLDVRWEGPGAVQVSFRGNADLLDLQDIAFIEPRLPQGLARGDFGLDLGDAGALLTFQGTDLASGMGRITATGGLLLAEDMGFRNLRMQMENVDLAITDPWVPDTLPLRGRMTGALSLDGTLASLQVEGRMDLVDPDSTGLLTADVSGLMGVKDGFTASSLHLTLAPLEWGTLGSISPAMKLQGSGAVRLVLTGDLYGNGLGIDGELTHVPSSRARSQGAALQSPAGTVLEAAGGASRVTVAGRVRRDSTDLFLDLTTTLRPLSLSSIRASYPSLPLQGEYSGRVDFRGPLSNLQITTDLQTSGGPLSMRVRLDARRPAEAYSVDAQAREVFILSSLLPSLPSPTQGVGSISATGRGFTLGSLQGEATIAVRQGLVGHLAVDSAEAVATVQDGVLLLQDFRAETGAGTLTGSGSLGLAPESSGGELTLQVHSESLEPLRPFFMEEPTLLRDDLTDFQQTALAATGVDLNTIPTAASVAVAGSADGEVSLTGRISDFSLAGDLTYKDLRLRTDYVQSGTLTLAARGLPARDARFEGELRTDSVRVRDLDFHSASVGFDGSRWGGRIRVTTNRSETESYAAQGTVSLDSIGGGALDLDQLTLQFDSIRWSLGGPASLAWSPDGYRIRDFQLIRPGVEAMRLRLDGFLPVRRGFEGDLQLEGESLNLARLATVLQMETPLRGFVDVRGRMTGTTDAPTVSGVASGRDLRYGDFSLGSMDGDFDYADQRFRIELRAGEGGRQVLSASGSFPADLRVHADSARIPDGPVDLHVVVDSLPAAVALAFLDTFEDVEGAFTGTLDLGGSTSDLAPSGDLVLTGGAASLPDLGVRHQNVEARFSLSPDGVVEVDGSLNSGGAARVTGRVTLSDPLSDPRLAIRMEAQNFLAVNRRDVQARLSGSVAIAGQYRRPTVSGALTVEQGVLMVDEVARNVEVVDLSDPAFFNVVGNELVTLRPVVASSQNPFLQNLRLDSMSLTMAQDSWLRGRELNVEMSGTLGVFWDRTERNMAFLGILDAVRGGYSVFGRQFQVQRGTVSFAGTPGINPDLDITAVNRVRDPNGDRLDIIANVEGSLLEPRVTLSSNSPFPLAESDLVSYLIFGRPSYALNQGQSGIATQAADMFTGATTSLAVGLFSSELGTVLAQDVGLDYLAITQGRTGGGGAAGSRDPFSTTQIEIGQYLTESIFAALQWRPQGQSANQNRLASVRLETRLSDRWTLEGYWEDRGLRSGLFGIGTTETNPPKIYGFFLFRQWGY